jgi:biotin operon repressor
MLSTIETVNVTSVHSHAFYCDASLSHIVLSDFITQIGESAFQSCTGLSNVVIPANVTTIGSRAFVSDSALASVYFLGAKPSTIGDYAFSGIKYPSTAYYLSSYASSWGSTPPSGFTYLATFTISDLRVAGYTASELQTLGVSDSAILGAGYSVVELLEIGFTAAQLRDCGVSATQFKDAGYSLAYIKNIGFTLIELLNNNTVQESVKFYYRDSYGDGWNGGSVTIKETSTNETVITLTLPTGHGGYSTGTLSPYTNYTITKIKGSWPNEAYYSITTIDDDTIVLSEQQLSSSTLSSFTTPGFGYTPSQLLTILGYQPFELKNAGYTIADLQGAGYSATDLQGAGYTIADLQGAGYTDSAILGAGYTATQLQSAGYTATQLQSAGYTITTPTTPSSNVCFPAKTPILTNCGPINIEDIDPAVHTIRNKKIVAITKTVAHDKNLVRIAKHALGHLYPEKPTLISQNHKVFFQGQMVKAKHLVDEARGVTLVPYNGEILYNVLLEQYEKMQVNNLIVETLHPEHKVAKLYRFLQNVDAAHHGKLIALFNQKDREQRLRR